MRRSRTCNSAAATIYARAKQGKHTSLYYFGDRDPSGVDIDRAVRQGIGESLLSLEMTAFATNDSDIPLRADWHLLRSLFDGDADGEAKEEMFESYATFERVAV